MDLHSRHSTFPFEGGMIASMLRDLAFVLLEIQKDHLLSLIVLIDVEGFPKRACNQ